METVPHTFRSELTAGTIVGGDFEVERRLASGGMGEVYVVKQRSTGARRALKRMHAHLVEDPVTRARFEREAKIVARIDSQHVAQVLAAGVDPVLGEPYIAMELLRGPTLAEVLKQGALSWPRAKMIMQGVGHAMAAAHRAGVIHRDLKPENVMLAESQVAGMDTIVKVLDFGVSLATKGTLAQRITGDLSVGTPHYMAPEQFSDSTQVSAATDVWALGLLLFEMLTAKKFWRVNLRSEAAVPLLIQEVVTDPIPSSAARAEEKGAALSLEISSWIDTCLQREPSLRFRDAHAAMTALNQIEAPMIATAPQQFEPTAQRAPAERASETVPVRAPAKIIASPQSVAPRATRWWPVAMLVLLALLVVGSVLVFARREHDEHLDAREPPRAAESPPAHRQPTSTNALQIEWPSTVSTASSADAATGDADAAAAIATATTTHSARITQRSATSAASTTTAQRDARAIASARARLRASDCLERGNGARTVGVWRVCFNALGQEIRSNTTNVRTRVAWCVHDSYELGRARGPAWSGPYCVDVSMEYVER